MEVTFHYNTPTEMLWDAVHFEELNAQLAENALDAGADVNARDEYGGTPLMSAAFGDCGKLIRLLLEHGAEVNATDNTGSAALSCAAAYNARKVTRILIEHGANIEARDNGGRTALHIAANCTDWIPHACHRLIKSGADIEAKDDKGLTPLMHAVHWKRYSAVRFLLRSGADANAHSHNGFSVLQWSRQYPPWEDGWEGMPSDSWRDESTQAANSFRLSHDRFDRFWYRVYQAREVVLGIPIDEYLALERLIKRGGAIE